MDGLKLALAGTIRATRTLQEVTPDRGLVNQQELPLRGSETVRIVAVTTSVIVAPQCPHGLHKIKAEATTHMPDMAPPQDKVVGLLHGNRKHHLVGKATTMVDIRAMILKLGTAARLLHRRLRVSARSCNSMAAHLHRLQTLRHPLLLRASNHRHHLVWETTLLHHHLRLRELRASLDG